MATRSEIERRRSVYTTWYHGITGGINGRNFRLANSEYRHVDGTSLGMG